MIETEKDTCLLECSDNTELPLIQPNKAEDIKETESKGSEVQCVFQNSQNEVSLKKPPSRMANLVEKYRRHTRTITSYDSQTSFYLKSMFFEVYSTQEKLTKAQRKEIQKRTGLPSRNITYWFSNHKRRSQKALNIYRETVDRSGGRVSTYKDFIVWRRSRNLPDHITLAELALSNQDK